MKTLNNSVMKTLMGGGTPINESTYTLAGATKIEDLKSDVGEKEEPDEDPCEDDVF